MSERYVHIYYGTGMGKTSAAFGLGVRAATEGKNVFVVQFMKGHLDRSEFVERLEPELKIFSFDKYEKPFCDLNEEEEREERIHIRNGIKFAKKVLVTEECDVLILDELLGLVEKGIVSTQEVIELIHAAEDDVEIIMTGISPCKEIWPYVNEVSEISTVYQNNT